MKQLFKIAIQVSKTLSGNGPYLPHKSFACSINTNFSRNFTFAYHVPYRQHLRCLAPQLDLCRTFNKNNGKRSLPDDMQMTKFTSQRKLRKRLIGDALERQKRIKKDVGNVIEERKQQLKLAEKKIRAKGKMIMKDIKDTKEKMKEKMEEIIERENVYTIPNLLCVTRILCSPLLGYLIVVHNFEFALGFMAVAGISDWVDGWLARNFKSQSSKLGSFLDPMADKVLIGTLFLSLTYIDLIPVALTALIIVRDVILIAAAGVIRFKSLPPPRTLSRYLDVSHATAQLAPTFVSKVNTGIQLVLVGSTLAAPVFGYVDHPILHGLWYLTAVSTVVAFGSYALSNKTYRYLKDKNKS